MKNTQKPFRIFLDTSSLLSGLNSPFGASGFIISLFKLKKIEICISHEVLIETKRAIKTRFPLLGTAFLNFLISRPILVKKLTNKELKSTGKILISEDTPILAGAIKARVDFLVTLDKKFKEAAQNKTNLEVLLPGEFLDKYRS